MEKRYQVFVSSTYADLKTERQAVIQALMEMDCIPAGMELFPATDQEQFEFIKKVIDDCDYYVLIVGGRYGSLTKEGISFTEREFEYAISKGMKVVAFLHSDPDSIPLGLSEKDPELRQKLSDFCKKVRDGRLVKFWTKADELPGLLALSLSKTIKTFPAIGWVRGNLTANVEILSEINELRKENTKLVNEREPVSSPYQIPDLADLDESFIIHGSVITTNGQRHWDVELTWSEIFAAIGPYISSNEHTSSVKLTLRDYALKRSKSGGRSPHIDDQDFQTISIQLRALGLIVVRSLRTTKGGMSEFWKLTPSGERLMVHLRAVKTKKADEEPAR